MNVEDTTEIEEDFTVDQKLQDKILYVSLLVQKKN